MNVQSFWKGGSAVAWTTADIPRLDGRVAVVTGANGGLGLETARALAAAGAHVVMAARDKAKALTAEEEVRRTAPAASLELVEVDLASLGSVKAAAASIAEHHQAVDILVNNAGVMGIPQRRTADGFEMQLGVDHLGHWALTAQLLPSLLAAPAARVVTVTSTAHHMGRALDPRNPHMEGRYGPWKAYGQAKLANFHFGLGLQQRFAAAAVRAQSLIAHPGLSRTELQVVSANEQGGPWSRFFRWSAARTGMSPAQGALPQLRAATDPAARGGEFYGPRYVNFGPPVRRPVLRRTGLRKAIEVLWEVSERETGIPLGPLDPARAAGGHQGP
jgi:NAD(P)-dependent dehydrogenase (short-subunit alcohol dehydrogenase family)